MPTFTNYQSTQNKADGNAINSAALVKFKFDLMAALEENQEINKVITIYPMGHLNMCTKFHGSPSNSCR